MWRGGAALALLASLAQGGCDRAQGVTVEPAKPAPRAAPIPPSVNDGVAVAETDPAKLLFRALLSQDVRQVDRLTRENPNLVNQDLGREERPLWLACSKGSLPLAKALVERGADVKAVNKKRQGVLWAAVQSDNVDLVKFLIEKGADAKALQEDDETLLWAASSTPMVELLVAAGVDPKHKSKLGGYAIDDACRWSRLEVVDALLASGVSVENVGRWNMRPLHFAASTDAGEPRELVQYLIDQKGADVNSRGLDGQTALHECVIFNRVEVASFLLSRRASVDVKDDKGRTPMDIARQMGDKARANIINLLIRYGAQGQMVPLDK